MNRIFGTSKPTAKPTLSDAIASTDSKTDSVDTKIRKLDAELARYRDQLSKLKDGPSKTAVKQRAMRVLKQRKLYENQRETLVQQAFNMEQAQLATDNLKTTAVTVDAMKLANSQLKKQYKAMDINKIENIQDEMEDLLMQANEFQDIMSRSYGLPDEIDESELEAELDALGDDLLLDDEQVPSYLQHESQPSFPLVPDSSSVSTQPQPQDVPLHDPAAPLKAT